jgi:A/G-specific adenine glycosylase
MPPVAAIRRKLLSWYRRHGRDLPWRRTRDPYAVWVSEIMLQQTRVAAVLDHYRRFLERFPDVESLAAASEDEVLALWSGLGYYRRARALRRAASAVVERYGGEFPSEPESMRELPGVGRYTAGAIASIAFDLAEPVLDGNVRRVLSRLLGESSAGDRRLWDVAAKLVEGPSPGDLNQAVMELGAVVCVPRSPACGRCPLSRHCRAYSSGRPEAFPARRAVAEITDVAGAVAVVVRARRFLLEKPGNGSLLRGTWDLPSLEVSDGDEPGRAVRLALRDRYGIEVRSGAPVGRITHTIMRRRLRLQVVPGSLLRGRIAGSGRLRWAGLPDLGTVPVSGATRKILQERLVSGRRPSDHRP